MKEKSIPASKVEYGFNMTGYIRNLLNLHGIPWENCESIGERVNTYLESMDWISTDSGITFEKTFIPGNK